MRDPVAMPDPMAKWTPAPDWTRARIIRSDWRARPLLGLTLTLLGGRCDRALADLARSAPFVGLWQVEPDLPIAPRIGRDKALLITTGEPVGVTGWREAGWTASDASDAQTVIEIEGAAAPDVIREAVAADLETGSPSAATLFAGVPALLYRTAPSVARLHVEAAVGPFIWRWLEKRLG